MKMNLAIKNTMEDEEVRQHRGYILDSGEVVFTGNKEAIFISKTGTVSHWNYPDKKTNLEAFKCWVDAVKADGYKFVREISQMEVC